MPTDPRQASVDNIIELYSPKEGQEMQTKDQTVAEEGERKRKRWYIWLMAALAVCVVAGAAFLWHEHHKSAGLQAVRAETAALAQKTAAMAIKLADEGHCLSSKERVYWQEELKDNPPMSARGGVDFLWAFQDEVGRHASFLNAEGKPAEFSPDGKLAPPPCPAWMDSMLNARSALAALDARLREEDQCPDEAQEALAQARAAIQEAFKPRPPAPGIVDYGQGAMPAGVVPPMEEWDTPSEGD